MDDTRDGWVDAAGRTRGKSEANMKLLSGGGYVGKALELTRLGTCEGEGREGGGRSRKH